MSWLGRSAPRTDGEAVCVVLFADVRCITDSEERLIRVARRIDSWPSSLHPLPQPALPEEDLRCNTGAGDCSCSVFLTSRNWASNRFSFVRNSLSYCGSSYAL